MIIFDLDGTLADYEHRLHFVDERKNIIGGYDQADLRPGWKPDWQAFYEACDQDKPIIPVLDALWNYLDHGEEVQIWSGRCESVRVKTIIWLLDNFSGHPLFSTVDQFPLTLKMRPIGDTTPDDQLKERWLDEAIAEGKQINFLFDYRPKVIRMWRRRGIFVFNCCQHDQEF